MKLYFLVQAAAYAALIRLTYELVKCEYSEEREDESDSQNAGKNSTKSRDDNKKHGENKFIKYDNLSLTETTDHPELPKEYEEMLLQLNKTGLLDISFLLNKFRKTMETFDDYADEVEKETGLKITGRVEFMNKFDDFIHWAQYILKLRLYKID